MSREEQTNTEAEIDELDASDELDEDLDGEDEGGSEVGDTLIDRVKRNPFWVAMIAVAVLGGGLIGMRLLDGTMLGGDVASRSNRAQAEQTTATSTAASTQGQMSSGSAGTTASGTAASDNAGAHPGITRDEVQTLFKTAAQKLVQRLREDLNDRLSDQETRLSDVEHRTQALNERLQKQARTDGPPDLGGLKQELGQLRQAVAEIRQRNEDLREAAIEKGDIDPYRNYTDPQKRQLQIHLKRLGLYDGPIDCLIGDGTRAAVRRFEETASLAKVDGVLPTDQLGLLQEAAKYTASIDAPSSCTAPHTQSAAAADEATDRATSADPDADDRTETEHAAGTEDARITDTKAVAAASDAAQTATDITTSEQAHPYVLRGVSEQGVAWISHGQSNDLIRVHEGDTLKGMGRVLQIAGQGQQWTVIAENGRIHAPR